MFGSTSIHYMMSCSTYDGALRIYNTAKQPRTWDTGIRPLNSTRQRHYSVRMDGDAVVFQLYRTDVVRWEGHTTVELDCGWDSATTRAFAQRFIPCGRFVRMYGQGCFRVGDVVARFGKLTLERQDGTWLISSPYEKPHRMVLAVDDAADVRKRLKPMIRWIKGIWAISGNDGTHPWVGVEELPRYGSRCALALDAIETGGTEIWEKEVKQFLRTHSRWMPSRHITQYSYAPTNLEDLLRSIYKTAYHQEDLYVSVQYDQPAPRRKP